MTGPARLSILTGVAVALSLAGCVDRPQVEHSEQMSGVLVEVAAEAERSFEYEAAARHYRTLYDRNGDDTDSLIGLGRNLRYSGSPKEAIKLLKKGIVEHGEWAALLVELGKAQIAANLIADARETLTKALEEDPDNWQAHSAMGIIHDRFEAFEKSAASYRKALELSPDNAAVINNLGLSLALSGKLDEGIRMLEKLHESELSTIQTRQNLAMLYALRGDFDSARALSLEDLPPEMAADNIAAIKRLH